MRLLSSSLVACLALAGGCGARTFLRDSFDASSDGSVSTIDAGDGAILIFDSGVDRRVPTADVPIFDNRPIPVDSTPVIDVRPVDRPTPCICDDGLFCNGIETCAPDGSCVSARPPCDVAMLPAPCWESQCNETARMCVLIPRHDRCMAGGVCTRTGCEEFAMCRTDADCDDGVYCNGSELCTRAGTCQAGVMFGCVTPGSCAIGRCDEIARACVSQPIDVDNDGYPPARCGGADCDDSNPAIRPGASENCSNATDDNCNGLTDCADRMSCGGRPPCADSGVPPRDTGVRDVTPIFDGPTPVDARGDVITRPDVSVVDTGVRDASVPFDGITPCLPSERGVDGCTNGIDDDCDGRPDCRDADCRPLGSRGECCNGLDDDGDGTIDLFACRCNDTAECAGVGDLEQSCWFEYQLCGPRCELYGSDMFCRELIDESTRCNAMTGECI